MDAPGGMSVSASAIAITVQVWNMTAISALAMESQQNN
ncbi:hypothetical protein EV13_2006 [Prochlorococcus sp. MIT 0702]|nr:hypothetical protein EV13_2006 [Prochlorococcus sp. MIT 0702]KGG28166.1 hypothetical protein EV12_0915 [Prochlorococcus sp. MIT 0701]KGG37216.1 hypothetical protein EV14_0007 [Prochlorococcus sp. MIT 0703]